MCSSDLKSPAPLSARRPDVPADLEAVVHRCLAKAPADRFPDCSSLEKALADCSTPQPWTDEEADRWWQSRLGRVGTADPGGQKLTDRTAG